jgi:hypothetical protein
MMNAAAQVNSMMRRQSRATQWSIYALLGLAVFLAWDQWIWPATQNIRDRADDLQGQVEQAAAGQILVAELKKKSFGEQVIAFGPVERPVGEADSRPAVSAAINALMKRHAVTEDSVIFSRGKVPRTTLSDMFGPGQVESLKVDFDFVADPTVVMAIIAELEADPAFEYIRSVRLNKAPNKKIKARLTLEAWITASGI